MNKLFLQYIQEKQKNNFEMISFKNSMRKNCWQKPLSIVESEVASTEVISAPPVNTTPNLFPDWWKGFPYSNPNQAPPVWNPGYGPFGPMDKPATPVWDLTPSGLGPISGQGNYDDIAPDADGDGIPDYRDPDYNYPVPDYGPPDPDMQDSDGDGLDDDYDNDMDNDGLPDSENDEYPGDYDNDGLPDEPVEGAWEDYDNDGIPNAYEDDDNDGEPNYMDPDSPFYGDQDTDNDGIVDPFDPYPMDYDNDGWPNLHDRDADGNGILDTEQGVFPDRDDDGIRDSQDEDTPYDRDGDGIPNNEDQYPYDPFNGQNPQGL